MKKKILLLLFFTGTYIAHAQKEKNIVETVIKCYEEYFTFIKQEKPQPIVKQNSLCLPEPDSFHHFFNTLFIDFRSLREREDAKTFSFSDSLCSPLKRDLIVTSPYGMRKGKKHYGVDFRVNIGDTVYSIFCGRVRIAKWDEQYGYVVVIRNYNMSETVYAHLDTILVKVNQEIEVGQPIGLGGNTGRSSGAHLHLELRYKGYPINPIVEDKFLKYIMVGVGKY